jgi:hypothetical protein
MCAKNLQGWLEELKAFATKKKPKDVSAEIAIKLLMSMPYAFIYFLDKQPLFHLYFSIWKKDCSTYISPYGRRKDIYVSDIIFRGHLHIVKEAQMKLLAEIYHQKK